LPTFVASESVARDAPRFYSAEDCSTPIVEQCTTGRGCLRCIDASPLSHACPSTSRYFLVQAPDPYDPFVAESQARSMATAMERAGNDVTLIVPTDAEMRASGCTPEGGSHGVDGCTLAIAGPTVHGALLARLAAE
jgi:hypothetical protein